VESVESVELVELVELVESVESVVQQQLEHLLPQSEPNVPRQQRWRRLGHL